MRNVGASIVELDKGKRYRIFAELPRDPKTGKRRRISKTIRGTRKQAERARLELMVKAGEPMRGGIALDDFFVSYYLPDAEKRLRPNTVHGYKAKHRRYIEDGIGRRDIAKITPLIINSWLDGIPTQNGQFEAYKMLRQILSRAVRWDMIESNPCSRVDPPKKERYRPEVLNLEGVKAYMAAFKGTNIEAGVLVSIGGGLRRSEVLGLSWDDVTPDGTVNIDNAMTSVGGKAHDDKPKTQFSERTVHLPASIMERLEELRHPGYPLVMDINANPMNPDNFSKQYATIRDSMPPEVPRIPFKNLRHTSLTLALESGADLFAVSRRAGHSSVSVTSAFYLRPDESIDRRTADSLDRMLR